MKLILVRHGRTLANENGILEGQLPGTLSAEGKRQIQKLAQRLKNEKLDHIYSSPLKRTADTARAVARYHPQTPLTFTDLLKENDLGPFEGKPTTSIDWNNPPSTIESIEQLDMRAKKLLLEICKKHPDGTVLLAGHNAINKALYRVITKDPNARLKQHNTAVNIFTINKNGKHTSELLNCTKHLE